MLRLMQASDIAEAAKPFWKDIAEFGILALIVAYLLVERLVIAKLARAEREQERKARHAAAEKFGLVSAAVDRNTVCVETNTRELRNLTYAMLAGGKVRPADTPPPIPKVHGEPERR